MTIEIDLTGRSCDPGRYITQFRTSKIDKELINEAAGRVGMTLAEFVRTVAYQAALEVHVGKGDYGRDARLPSRSA